MPHFLADAIARPVMPVEPSEPFGAYLQEYKDLGDGFHSTMTFSDFCNMKSRNKPRGSIGHSIRILCCNALWGD